MQLFQIIESAGELNHAGTKATADIATIAEKIGFKQIKINMYSEQDTLKGKIYRQIGYFRDWESAYKEIPSNSVVLLQHPFHYNQLTREKILFRLKSKKKVRFISFVHDVEELRVFRYNNYYAKEFESMLSLADVLIVHNSKMKHWFMQKNVPENKLINLQVFDYLQNTLKSKNFEFSKSIVVAGNLDTVKCGYIGHLGELKGIKVNLYGPNFNESMRRFDNVIYQGSFLTDEIPNKLNGGFGLVWDGDSIDSCCGLSGQYLHYNNPHKLSLYLSSGLPVIIWSQAAAADFVKRNHVGITINSLHDLPDLLSSLPQDYYLAKLKALRKLQAKLITGQYGSNALKKAIAKIEEN